MSSAHGTVGTPGDASTDPAGPDGAAMDPALLAVLAKRFDAVVREMTNTLLRTGRSTVLAVARDLSTAIVTADNALLSAAEGLPVHTFGSHVQSASMCELHPDLREGDAFLDNDPYIGNTHHADHTILVPVFIDGEHMFTTCAKAHQADSGNSIPSTYHPFARDLYEEGSLCFTATQVQRDYTDIADIIRICRRRIRVPDQWYGDYLAMLAAARTGERRLHELVAKYGKDTVRRFVREWLDYSERRVEHAIRQLPGGTATAEGGHDPFGPFTEGIPVRVTVTVDPAEGRVEVDLRDNIDAIPAGVNESRTCSISNAMTGVLNILGPDIPINAGTFRRIDVLIRDNCVVGAARHPTSASVATTNVGDRLINITQYAMSQLCRAEGLAEGGVGVGAGAANVSGNDARTGAPFVSQLILAGNGGPANARTDGWLSYGAPCGAGLIYRDSIELNELRYPILFRELRTSPDSGGAGYRRGATSATVEYGPRYGSFTAAYAMDGFLRPARGTAGGRDGEACVAEKVDADGAATTMNGMVQVELTVGETLRGTGSGGGGYGDPLRREPERVLHDCLEGYVTEAAARDVYGVVVVPGEPEVGLRVDAAATTALRERLAGTAG